MVATFLLMQELTASSGDLLKVIFGLAVVVSAVGLIIARQHFTTRHYVSATLGMVLWLGGVSVLGIFEVSYWHGSFSAKADMKKVEDLASSGRQSIIKQAMSELESYEDVKSDPATIQAKLNGMLDKYEPTWAGTLKGLTKDCTKPASWLAEKCNEVSKLKVELARATTKKELEEKVWGAATSVKPSTLFEGVTAAATWLQSRNGGSIEHWRDVVMACLLGLFVLGRDVALYLSFTPSAARKKEGGFIELRAISTTKEAPEVAQLIQPDPVAQISAQKPSEEPSEPASLAPSLAQAKDEVKDAPKDEPKIDRRKAKKEERKRLGSGPSATYEGNVTPFPEGGAKPGKARTLRDLVVAYCAENEGTIPFSEIYAEIKRRAGKRIAAPRNKVGPILEELGHEWCKPRNVVSYAIRGGQKQPAFG